MIASAPKPVSVDVFGSPRTPPWAVDVIKVSAALGLAAHAYLWWRAYQLAASPSADRWPDPRFIAIPFLLGLPVLLAAYRRRTWACLVLLGATLVGLVGGITWLAGALQGEDVVTASGLMDATDRSVMFLLPSILAVPLAAACGRLGMFADPVDGPSGRQPGTLAR